MRKYYIMIHNEQTLSFTEVFVAHSFTVFSGFFGVGFRKDVCCILVAIKMERMY